MKQNLKDFGLVNIILVVAYGAIGVAYLTLGMWIFGAIWVLFALGWVVVGLLRRNQRAWYRRELGRWDEYRRTGNIEDLYTTKQHKRDLN